MISDRAPMPGGLLRSLPFAIKLAVPAPAPVNRITTTSRSCPSAGLAWPLAPVTSQTVTRSLSKTGLRSCPKSAAQKPTKANHLTTIGDHLFIIVFVLRNNGCTGEALHSGSACGFRHRPMSFFIGEQLHHPA